MLKLIKNEYIKIFTKGSTYILLSLLLISLVGIPILGEVLGQSIEDYSITTYDSELEWYTESDPEYQKIIKAKELKIPEKEYFCNTLTWRANALDILYYEVAPRTESADTKELASEYQKLFDDVISFLKNNDYKGYFNYMLNFMDTTSIDLATIFGDVHQIEKQKSIYQYILDTDANPCNQYWKLDSIYKYAENKSEYDLLTEQKEKGFYIDEKHFEYIKQQMLIEKYRLDNGVENVIYKEVDSMFGTNSYHHVSDIYSALYDGIAYLAIILIILIIAAGTIIANEFSQGTIKFLLINPHTRSKILWSKYLTVFSYGAILTAITFIITFIMALILNGGDSLNTVLLEISNDSVIGKSALLFAIGRYVLAFSELVISFTVAFFISSLFRNSSLSIAISLIVYFVGNTLCEVAALLNLDFFRYTIFANTTITNIIDGNSSFLHHTPTFAFTVIAIHMFLLLLSAHDAFTKRNV